MSPCGIAPPPKTLKTRRPCLGRPFDTKIALHEQGLAPVDAQADVRDTLAWHPLPITGDLLNRAFDVESRYGLSWWDALIVAAARALACTTLLPTDSPGAQAPRRQPARIDTLGAHP